VGTLYRLKWEVDHGWQVCVGLNAQSWHMPEQAGNTLESCLNRKYPAQNVTCLKNVNKSFFLNTTANCFICYASFKI
jgi:hypothetical protein